MTLAKDATLLDVITDGFEGIQGALESANGWRERLLPCPTSDIAAERYAAFVSEAVGWKGKPTRTVIEGDRAMAAWPDLQIRWMGRGVLVLVPDPAFDAWWHDDATWDGDPMDDVRAWAREVRYWVRDGGP